MEKQDCYRLGKITKKHGFKGNLILHFDTDNKELYKELESVFVEINGILVPFFFNSLQPHAKDKYLARFEDLTPEEAENMVNRSLYLPLDSLEELEDEEFYFHEILGFEVIDSIKGSIGHIENVNDTGTQYLFDIRQGEKQILIPVVEDWILEVNHDKRFIELVTPEGLIDLYLG